MATATRGRGRSFRPLLRPRRAGIRSSASTCASRAWRWATRPVPHFAFDLGVDLLAGTDYNGFQRTEVPVSLSGILYVNPRSRLQFYLMFGGNVSRAQVRSDLNAPQLAPVDGGSQFGATYTYAGGQGG